MGRGIRIGSDQLGMKACECSRSDQFETATKRPLFVLKQSPLRLCSFAVSARAKKISARAKKPAHEPRAIPSEPHKPKPDPMKANPNKQ